MNLQQSGATPASPDSLPSVQERAGGNVIVLGLLTGFLLALLPGLAEDLLHAPLFSGQWLGVFASTSWGSNIGILLLIFGAGPAIVFLVVSRFDPAVRSDTRLRDRLLPGVGALSGSYFLVLFFSLVLERIMPFPPAAVIWILVQGCLTLGLFLALRVWYSRYYAVPLRWIPGRKETFAFLLIILFVLVILFVSGNVVANLSAVFPGRMV